MGVGICVVWMEGEVVCENGIETQNVLPLPNSLWTDKVPFIRDVSSWVMANPKPVPPYFRVVEPSTWVNALNISDNLFGECQCLYPLWQN